METSVAHGPGVDALLLERMQSWGTVVVGHRLGGLQNRLSATSAALVV